MFETRSFITSKKDALFDQLLSSLSEQEGGASFERYATDPVGFGQQVLGETYTDDVKVLMESVRDFPITVARSANAVGKTHGAARVAVWFYKVFPNSQVFTAAAPPESNLRKLLWGQIGGLIGKHPDLFKGDEVTTLHIQRSPQSYITGVTIPSSGTDYQREAKFSGKHAPHLLFVLDEGDAIPDEVYRGIDSCMSGGFARLLIMLNPRAETGAAYRLERDRAANVVHLSAFRHPNVITGYEKMPGAVTREKTVQRINRWCRQLAQGERREGDCFELPAFLVGSTAPSEGGSRYPPLPAGWYKVMEPAFSYMVLGRYPGQAETQLVSREWVNRARSRWDAYVAEHGELPPIGTKAVHGQDVAEFGVDMNVACFRYGGYVERLVWWGGIDTIETGERAAQESKKRKVSSVAVDATSVGAGVAPHMRRLGCSAFAVKVASSPTEKTELGEFKILRDQLWWACREWLRKDTGAMLPPDEELIEELLTPTYDTTTGKVRVMSKDTMKEKLKRSPDRADALCLTFAKPGRVLLPDLELEDIVL